MKTSTLAIVLITLMCLTLKINAQQDQFVIGAYMQSTPWEREPPNFNFPDSALFSLWRASALGINTAMVYVRQPGPDQNINYSGNQNGTMNTNMDELEEFPNVIAMNPFSSHIVLDSIPPYSSFASPYDYNITIRNFDYIFFYSGAYYSKWDATKDVIPLGELGLKHDDDFGSKILYNGKEYWSSDTGHAEGLLVKGPNYNQETRYRSSTYPTSWSNATQTYIVYFDMILRDTPLPTQLNDPMCEILVYSKYKIKGTTTIGYDILANAVLTVGEIGNPSNRRLTYDFSTYCQNAFLDKMQDIENSECPDGSKQLVDVEFRVKYLNPDHELLIDYIEVYDHDIWDTKLSREDLRDQARQNIANYLQKFTQANAQFYTNNLKYFYGVDEPHTVDAYIPHAFVQGVLDSLNNVWPEGAPQLFTHFYPEWNGLRNAAWVIPPYVRQ